MSKMFDDFKRLLTSDEKRAVFRSLRWDGDGQLVDHGFHGRHNQESLASIGLNWFGLPLGTFDGGSVS